MPKIQETKEVIIVKVLLEPIHPFPEEGCAGLPLDSSSVLVIHHTAEGLILEISTGDRRDRIEAKECIVLGVDIDSTVAIDAPEAVDWRESLGPEQIEAIQEAARIVVDKWRARENAAVELRELRDNLLAMSRPELGRLVGVGGNTAYRWERPGTPVPRASNITKFERSFCGQSQSKP